MHKLSRASEKDLPAAMKLLRRVVARLEADGNMMWSEGYPEERDFAADIAAQTLFVIKEKGRILASASVSFDVKEEFFAETHSDAKAADLLDKARWDGSPILILHRLMVDPAFWGQGLGYEMIAYLKTAYPHRFWIFVAATTDEKAVRFYVKHGFVDHGKYVFEYVPGGLEAILISSR